MLKRGLFFPPHHSQEDGTPQLQPFTDAHHSAPRRIFYTDAAAAPGRTDDLKHQVKMAHPAS